jgi:uncharacterized metal-binding protein YceD (DUF177 family)
MSAPEFSRPFDVRQLDHRAVSLAANEAERKALAARFGLVRIDRLEAEVTLTRKGNALDATGTLVAQIVQSCAVSAEDLPLRIDEPLILRFVPENPRPSAEEEVELEPDALDEVPFSGSTVDLGEAVAQSLALAIDPFAVGPEAERARALFGDGPANPFAGLADLKKSLE